MAFFLRLFLLLSICGCLCSSSSAASPKIHVLIWSEGTEPKNIYPEGINGALANALKKQPDMEVSTGSLQLPDLGLSTQALDHTDVLIWFGHEQHAQVPDEIADRIAEHVKQQGMGLIALHSSHFSKPFRLLLNASGAWADYKETGQPETIKIVAPGHPIAKNVQSFTIPKTEMFAEPFQVPEPEAVIMVGAWDGQHKSREVMTWTVGKGRLVYIRAGHEAYPIYFMPPMQQIIVNAVRWTAEKSHQKKA